MEVINECGKNFHRRIIAFVHEKLLKWKNLSVKSEDDAVEAVKNGFISTKDEEKSLHRSF